MVQEYPEIEVFYQISQQTSLGKQGPSGKRLHDYGTPPFLFMGRPTTMFNSYVAVITRGCIVDFHDFPIRNGVFSCLFFHNQQQIMVLTTILNGKTHHKLPCSIVVPVITRGSLLSSQHSDLDPPIPGYSWDPCGSCVPSTVGSHGPENK